MPSLAEIRKWLFGDPVPGMPNNPMVDQTNRRVNTAKMEEKLLREILEDEEILDKTSGVVDVAEEARKAVEDEKKPKKKDDYDLSGCRYVISKDGNDALLLFGKHRDNNVSTLATDWAEGREYLKWLLKQSSLPTSLRTIINLVLTGHPEGESLP